MKYLADTLTVLRFVLAVIVAVLIVFYGNWEYALELTAIGILTDAFDGVAARKWPIADEDRFHPFDGHAFDNMADAALCGVLVFAPALRLILARVNGWQDGWLPLWAVILLLVVECLATPFFLLATAKLQEDSARRIDIIHGWYAALLMVGSLVLITVTALSPAAAFAWTVTFLAVAALMIPFKWDRATSRPDGVYEGALTWSQFLTGRWK